MTTPIPLTQEQIDDILDAVPTPPGVGTSAIKHAHKYTLDRLRRVLQTIRLVPSKVAFSELKQGILDSMYRAFVEPGAPVGVTAGVSLGGPITQLSLNTFHQAGDQSGVALAFQKVRDFLTGSKTNRNPQMRIFLKTQDPSTDIHDVLHHGTFDSIMAMRHEFEQTTVQDLVEDKYILSREEALALGVDKMRELHAYLRPDRLDEEKYRLNSVLQLRLNTYRMYTHKITMAMVSKAIEGSSEHNDVLVCVWRSQQDGKMYILLDETKDFGPGAFEIAAAAFFNRIVIPSFGRIHISGVPGILSIEPVQIDVISGIYNVERDGRLHYVYTSNKKTRWEGISLADIRQLLERAGYKVRPIDQEAKDKLRLVVEDYTGQDLVKDLQERIQSSTEGDELHKAASFYYILTNGSNMRDLVWRDDIDLYRLTSGHSHEIAEYLGIDAARVFLILRFIQTLQDFSTYINPRHISLVFDLLCNLGIVNSLSVLGLNRRKVGPLAMASYERSMDVFTNAAIFGEKETITGVSPAIYVGQQPRRVGTGSIAVVEDVVDTTDKPPMPSAPEIPEIQTTMSLEDLLKAPQPATPAPRRPEPMPALASALATLASVAKTGASTQPAATTKPSTIEVDKYAAAMAEYLKATTSR